MKNYLYVPQLLWVIAIAVISLWIWITSASSWPVLSMFGIDGYSTDDKEVIYATDGDEIWVKRVLKRPDTTYTSRKTETERAILYLYDIGATKFSIEKSFEWDWLMTREQAAKLLYTWADEKPWEIGMGFYECSFTDLEDGMVDPTLKDSVIKSCQFWLFKWHDGLFSPKEEILRWHFFMVILRALRKENVTEATVYDLAKEAGLTTTTKETFWFNNPITRRDASLILYRADLWGSEKDEALKSAFDGGMGMAYLSESMDSSVVGSAAWDDSGIVAREMDWDHYQSSSPLQWWEIDDNLHFDEFMTYYEGEAEKFWKDYTQINMNKRYHIVVNNVSSSFLETTLSISDNVWNLYEVSIDATWEIYFYPSAYYDGEDSNLNEVTTYTIEGGLSENWDEVVTMSADVYEREINTDWSYETIDAPQPSLNLVFVIDTTGSMWDQIKKIKETIQSVVTRVEEEHSWLTIRYWLVAYRDKYDSYLTSAYQFTDDLQEYQRRLDTLQAGWWWDYKEDMNSWLEDALEYLDWHGGLSTNNIIFLVADAPPHMDYQQEYTYRVALLRAVEKGIKIFPLASSWLDNTVWELIFRQIALVTNASYVFITKWSSWKTDYHVDEQMYSVDSLDDLLVNIIKRVLNAWE